jgi:hypothetical protein
MRSSYRLRRNIGTGNFSAEKFDHPAFTSALRHKRSYNVWQREAIPTQKCEANERPSMRRSVSVVHCQKNEERPSHGRMAETLWGST